MFSGRKQDFRFFKTLKRRLGGEYCAHNLRPDGPVNWIQVWFVLRVSGSTLFSEGQFRKSRVHANLTEARLSPSLESSSSIELIRRGIYENHTDPNSLRGVFLIVAAVRLQSQQPWRWLRMTSMRGNSDRDGRSV